MVDALPQDTPPRALSVILQSFKITEESVPSMPPPPCSIEFPPIVQLTMVTEERVPFTPLPALPVIVEFVRVNAAFSPHTTPLEEFCVIVQSVSVRSTSTCSPL